MINKIIPTEYDECLVLVQYLELKNIKYSAIAHSTYTTSWSQKMKNKQTGLKRGVPDYLICLPKQLLFIEMKRIKGGVISEYQKSWIEALNNINKNIVAVVCKGADEAIKQIQKYEL